MVFSLPKDARKDIVSRTREGCAPLFVVCKRGNLEIAEFLITICGADIEQRGHFENPEDSTVHLVTPLWCASVSGKLPGNYIQSSKNEYKSKFTLNIISSNSCQIFGTGRSEHKCRFRFGLNISSKLMFYDKHGNW